MMSSLRASSFLHRSLRWAGPVICGGIWGLGLARVLAQDLRIALAYGWVGVSLTVLVSGLLAVTVHKYVSRGHRVGWYLPLLLPVADLMAAGPQPWRGPVLLVGALCLVVALLIRLPTWVWVLLSGLVPFLVYLTDVSPYVGRADTFEFQVIGPQLGIAHPSGYPLYTLLCKLFSLLPVSTVAWRVNLSSAVFAALAASFVFLTLTVLTGATESKGLRLVAFIAAQVLAFSPTLWQRAVEAEVYALNALLVVLFLWVTARWQLDKMTPDRAWPILGLLIGLALASHITLGALGLIALTGLRVRRRRPAARAWVWAIAFGLLGVALYAYIPLRWPAVTGGERMSLAAFLRFVSNADSGGALRPSAFYSDPSRWGLVGDRLLSQVGWGGLALAVVGLIGLASHLPALAAGSLLAFMAWVWFGLSFYVADPDYSAFLIPAHIVLIVWLGYGAQTLLHRLELWWHGRLPEPVDLAVGQDEAPTSLYGPLSVGLLSLLALSRIWQTGPVLDTTSLGRSDELWARYVLQRPLAEGAAILADSEKFPPLYYLQQVQGLRTDLDMVTLFSEDQYRADLEARLAVGQPVYLARYLPGMDAFGVSSVGPLVAVAPSSLTRPSLPSGVAFGEDLLLRGHDLQADPKGRVRHHLTLAWQTTAVPEDDLEVRLRLVDPEVERVVWEADATRPVAGYTTTVAWQAGWQVDDYHALVWPAWLPPGVYRLEVGLFPRFQEEGLPVAGTDRMWHILEEVTIPVQAAPNPALTARMLFDGRAWLVGVGAPNEVPAGRAMALDLAWRCGAGAQSLGVPQFHWRSPAGRVARSGGLAAVGQASTFAFCGEGRSVPVLRRYEIEAPSQPGRYALAVGLEGTSARCGWLRPTSAVCEIAEIVIGSADAGLANFAGQIVLVAADVDASGVPAGGPLTVDLTWRALRPLERDYTVFLQVIGPDGRLYGQVDSWPVQGARPTTSWEAGETVRDPYRFYIDADGPAGEYQVIVGWYLLADMSRLPVVDTDGRQVGDYRQIGAFELP